MTTDEAARAVAWAALALSMTLGGYVWSKLDARVTGMEGIQIEARFATVEANAGNVNNRLDRIERKLDRILDWQARR